MTTPSQNPLLNKLPTDKKTTEIGFLIVLLVIITLICIGFFILKFGVPVIESMLLG